MKPAIRSGISSFPIFNEGFYFSIRRHKMLPVRLWEPIFDYCRNVEPSPCSVSRRVLASSRFDSLSSEEKEQCSKTQWVMTNATKRRCGGNVLSKTYLFFCLCLRKFPFHFLNGIINLNKYTNCSGHFRMCIYYDRVGQSGIMKISLNMRTGAQ